MNRSMTAADCPSCRVNQVVERDEDGVPDMDLVPCQGSDTCKKPLCQFCRIKCVCCGLHACDDHIRDVEGDMVCDLCAKEPIV